MHEETHKLAWRRRLEAVLDRLQAALFARTRRVDSLSGCRERGSRRSGIEQWSRKLLVGVAAAGLLGGFNFIYYYYSKSMARVADHALVINLAKPTFTAKLHFGDSPLCDGQVECWHLPDWDDRAWHDVTLPNFDIRSLPGYREALRKGAVYYRMKLDIPDKLRQLGETIAFSPGWVNHRHFEVYLNGRQVFEGEGTTLQGSLVSLSLPARDVAAGPITVSIKGSVANADVGIRHFGGILLGPKAVLDELYVSDERINITYFLLILLSKGSVFVIFALFYFFTKAQRGFFDFLVYAFCVTVENVFIMSAVLSSFNVRVTCYFLAKTMAIIALQRFFAHHYEVHRVRTKLLWLGALQLVAVSIMVFDHGWGSKTVTVPTLLRTTNYMLVGTLMAAVLVGLVNLRMYRRMQVGASLQRGLMEFAAVTGIYLVLLIWEVFFNEYRGIDMRAVLDLIFFYYMALVSARHTGFNEGKILTLEAHMEEKRRMEAELQEAAAIAKVFLPDSVPRWPSLDIAVHHKPLTEASGDWYAFEQAPSGRYYHCLICDITGHGVQAAIIVSTCRTVLSSLVANDPDVLEREDFVACYARVLNHTLFMQGAGQHSSTMVGLTFVPDEGVVHYMAAGHPPAMYWAATGAERTRLTPLQSRHNVLGVSAEFCGAMQTAPFGSGDQLLAYTDGVALGRHFRTLRRFLAEREVSDDLNTLPRDLYEAVWAEEMAKHNREPDDDVSIIWFRSAA